MSRRNPIRLEPGREYQLDGKKRRWRVVHVTGLMSAPPGVVTIRDRQGRTLVLSVPDAQRRLREVQD